MGHRRHLGSCVGLAQYSDLFYKRTTLRVSHYTQIQSERKQMLSSSLNCSLWVKMTLICGNAMISFSMECLMLKQLNLLICYCFVMVLYVWDNENELHEMYQDLNLSHHCSVEFNMIDAHLCRRKRKEIVVCLNVLFCLGIEMRINRRYL